MAFGCDSERDSQIALIVIHFCKLICMETELGRALELRTDFSAAELRKLARRCGHHRQSCRLLSIAAIYDGMNRTDAAAVGGMDRQTLRDWVIRFNESGPDGLKDLYKGAPGRKLNDAQLAELAQIVEAGPDLERDGVVRWRRVDLQQLIEERFGVTYHERTVSKLLKALGFSKLAPRPQHPAQDERMIETFKKTSRISLKPT